MVYRNYYFGCVFCGFVSTSVRSFALHATEDGDKGGCGFKKNKQKFQERQEKDASCCIYCSWWLHLFRVFGIHEDTEGCKLGFHLRYWKWILIVTGSLSLTVTVSLLFFVFVTNHIFSSFRRVNNKAWLPPANVLQMLLLIMKMELLTRRNQPLQSSMSAKAMEKERARPMKMSKHDEKDSIVSSINGLSPASQLLHTGHTVPLL